MVCAGHGTVTYAADDGGIGDKYEGEWLNGDACMPFSDRIGSESILMSGVRVCVSANRQDGRPGYLFLRRWWRVSGPVARRHGEMSHRHDAPPWAFGVASDALFAPAACVHGSGFMCEMAGEMTG